MKWISTWVKTAPLITSSRIRLRSYTPARMDAIDAVNPAADAKAVLVETVLDPHAAPVFDLFVQERQAIDRSQGGLGLGLTIVLTSNRLVQRLRNCVSHLPLTRCTGSTRARTARSVSQHAPGSRQRAHVNGHRVAHTH
jgi:hypothetical protein